MKRLVKAEMQIDDFEKIRNAEKFLKDLETEYVNSMMKFQNKANEMFDILSDDMKKNNNIKNDLCTNIVKTFGENMESSEVVIENALSRLDGMKTTLKQKFNM